MDIQNTGTSLYTIEIPLNKKKIGLLLAGSLIFFSSGLWIVFGKSAVDNPSWMNSTKLTIAGYGALLLFGLGSIFFSRRFFDKTPGLIIDNNGIMDNVGAFSTGTILWSDIENISKFEMQGQNFLLIQVKNPDFYIEQQTNLLKRKAMALNKKIYGTPIFISANTLNINFQELFQIVNSRVN